jgi:FtsH-binding integral membrane protein
MFAVRHKHPYNYTVLALFTVCTGYSLGVVAASYSPATVVTALSLTASATAAVAALAYVLRNRDLSLFGMGLMAAGWVFLGALLATSFLSAGAGSGVALGAIGAVLFCAYTLFDLWLMMQHRGIGLDEHMIAALTLYIDLINLFTFILGAMGSTERE